jgi:hypothetical protein
MAHDGSRRLSRFIAALLPLYCRFMAASWLLRGCFVAAL